MSGLEERTVVVNGYPARIWEKGSGPRLGYLAGLAGAPTWSPFLESLSQTHRVVVPSLPGFPGAPDYEHLDTLTDWVAATLDLIEASDLSGADFAASSIGAMLALEMAALSPASVGRLALLAPLGLHDEHAPVPHIWARKSADMAAYLCEDTEALAQSQAAPEGVDVVDWNLMIARASAAGARLLWPMCELGLVKRLHRVRQSVLFVWGERDRIMAPSYATKFKERLSGVVQITTVPDAGHLLDIDAPSAAAQRIQGFLQETTQDRRQRRAG